ncbi:MAG: bifunctional transaldolase/phosoglucose isomerase [Gemmatimonadota bacterium]
MTNPNPLRRLEEHGQSYWLDNLTRSKIHGGELARRIRREGLKGVTSNPAIFRKALASGDDYYDQIQELAARGCSVSEIYEKVVTRDIRDACDALADVHRESDGRDGFVSLEVSPHLAYDPDGTLAEARRLYEAVDRPNVMIKIPATEVALPVIEEALYEGINVNITLLFSVERYISVAEAYLAAMTRRANERLPLRDVASVASFFLSRIDVLTDELLAQRIGEARSTGETPRAGPETLLGRAAVACARHAYDVYHTLFSGDEWERLADAGARAQRLLWASTSNKTPIYDDLRYVEPLIGPDTVTTLPDSTAAEYARRGRPATRLRPSTDPTNEVGERLATFGVDLASVARRLEEEGVRKFIAPYDALLTEIARHGNRAIAQVQVDAANILDVDELMGALQDQRIGRRLFAQDTSLWSWGDDRATEHAMGWLQSPEDFLGRVDELRGFVDELRDDGIEDVVMVGMGGSTNAAKVARAVFGRPDRTPFFRVLADTDPDAVARLDDEVDWSCSVVIVASKSGTTQETLSLFEHCWSRVSDFADRPGRHFVAITDEGTPLADTAEERDFRKIFLNPSSIGGRYSALSYFGLVPLALAGADIEAVLRDAIAAEKGCGPDVPAAANPALRLGGLLGALAAHHGRDKVTLTFSDEIGALGLWVRQLLAESTGKDGRGLVPILDEPPRPVDEYAPDRVFVHTCLWNGHDPLEEDPTLGPVLEKGHPVVRIRVPSREALGGEFMRWEIATAVSAVLLHVDPFNQPDVEATKRATRELLSRGSVGDGHGVRIAEAGDVALWRSNGTTPSGAPTRQTGAAAEPLDPIRAALSDFLMQGHDGDYVALLPFLRRTDRTHEALQALRAHIQQSFGMATTLAYGPAYLHSVGQLHKGGPDNGLFVVLTNGGDDEGNGHRDDPTIDELTALHEAQALADFDTLAQAGRRVVRLQMRSHAPETLGHLSDGWISGRPAPAESGAVEPGGGETPASP